MKRQSWVSIVFITLSVILTALNLFVAARCYELRRETVQMIEEHEARRNQQGPVNVLIDADGKAWIVR